MATTQVPYEYNNVSVERLGDKTGHVDPLIVRGLNRGLTHLDGALANSSRLFFSLAEEISQGMGVMKKRLHHKDVLLFWSDVKDADLAAMEQWLTQEGFQTERAFRFFRATTDMPITDGFCACLCIQKRELNPPQADASGQELSWVEIETGDMPLRKAISEFISQESERICPGGFFSCEAYFKTNYARERERAPKLFRFFDLEYAGFEFAASMWSPDELCFWSRPVQYPK